MKFNKMLRSVVVFICVMAVISINVVNKSFSSNSNFYGYSCAQGAEEYYTKVVPDGYVLGLNQNGRTKAFSFYQGKPISEAENEMKPYESYDCAHFVSSCLFRWGRYFLRNDYRPDVDGFVSASYLYSQLTSNDGNSAYIFVDALKAGYVSLGDPVFFLKNGRITHSTIYVGDETVAYHSNSGKNKYVDVLNNGFSDAWVVHINNNQDDYKDTPDKFYYSMKFTITDKAQGGLRIRENHSTRSRVIGSAFQGNVGTIQSGQPVYEDGRYWWYVSINNVNGWCAGEFIKRY